MYGITAKILPLTALMVALAVLAVADQEKAVDEHLADSLQAWGYQVCDASGRDCLAVKILFKAINSLALAMDIAF